MNPGREYVFAAVEGSMFCFCYPYEVGFLKAKVRNLETLCTGIYTEYIENNNTLEIYPLIGFCISAYENIQANSLMSQ